MRKSHPIALLVLLSLFGCTTLLYAFISSGRFPTTYSLHTIAVAASLLYSSALVIYFVISRRFALIDVLIIYFIFFSVFFSGLYQIASNFFPWPQVHDADDAYSVVLVYLIFITVYALTRTMHRTTPLAERDLFSSRTASRYGWLLIVFSFMCIFAAGPSLVFSARSEAASLGTSGSEQLILIGKSLGFTAYVIALLRFKNRKRRSWGSLWFLVASLALGVVWFNPVTSPRFHFLAFLIATATVALSLWNPGSVAKSIVLSAVALANYVVFGPLKSLGAGLTNFDLSFFQNFESEFASYVYGVDFDAMQVSLNGIRFMEINGPIYLRNIIDAGLFFVPRELSPGKSLGTGIIVHERLGYFYTNLSFPLPMELYLGGGMIGVIIGSYLVARIFTYYTSASKINSKASVAGISHIYYALLAGYMPIILRGSLNAVIAQFGFSFLALAGLQLLMRLESAKVDTKGTT